ncbi:MAG: hypothetical protein NZ561_00555, partial [Phycisphaerae bacterium]|nr:hypothetical protein [Phycisphaerae bacterium]
AHLDEADDLADDLELFGQRRPDVLPALELGGGLGRVSEEQASNRLRLIHRLAAKVDPPELIVAPIPALMQSVPARDELRELVRPVGVGEMIEPEKLIVWLSEHGYQRLDQVEAPGDFAVRGGIIDVYIPGDAGQLGQDNDAEQQVGLAVRIDFFGDQVESIRQFDLASLGSGAPLQQVVLLDITGRLPELSSGTHLLSYLDSRAIVAFWAPLEIAEQARSYLDRLPDQRGVYPLSAVVRNSEPFRRLELHQFDQATAVAPSIVSGNAVRIRLPVRSLQRFETEVKRAIGELAALSATHEVTVFCENEGERQRLVELLEQDSPGLSARLTLARGYLHRGFVFEEEGDGFALESTVLPGTGAPAGSARGLAFLGHHELFHRYEQRRRVRRVIPSRPVDSFLDLQPGDYVVHVAHGIARFSGIQTIEKDGRKEEYLTLRFADNATLHVPASRVNLVQKYVGGFQGSPRLSRLGSDAWRKQKERVSEAVMDMAAELIEVQAARSAEAGTAYPPDTPWQQEFEAEFPYTPTEDQVIAADEIKRDMQKSRPMDRLLCGDVGYGKTELAMRAAFKA